MKKNEEWGCGQGYGVRSGTRGGEAKDRIKRDPREAKIPLGLAGLDPYYSPIRPNPGIIPD